MIAALASPVLLLLGAGAMDMARYRGAVDELQNIADFASIAGAREMILANSNQSSIENAVSNVISSRMQSLFGNQPYTQDIDVRMDDAEVFVKVSFQVNGMLGQNLFPENGLVKADSVAVAAGSTKICAISLDIDEDDVFSLQDQSSLQADGCSLYTNSYATNAVSFSQDSSILAEVVCSGGGIANYSDAFKATALTDCPTIEDPLKDRRQPRVRNNCDEVDYSIGDISGDTLRNEEENDKDGDSSGGVRRGLPAMSAMSYDSAQTVSVTLRPGIYCGGIKIGRYVNAAFEPGIYIIKEGPLEIFPYAVAKGEGVGFYLTGVNSMIDFEENSEISFSAPVDGTMAGILFWENRRNPKRQIHKISTHLARELLGTIYLSRGHLFIEATDTVGEDSDFTIIIAKWLVLRGQSSLYLNTDYSNTEVPVPEGVGPIGGSAYLRN